MLTAPVAKMTYAHFPSMPRHWTACRGWTAKQVRDAFVRPGQVRFDPRFALERLGVQVISHSDVVYSGAVSTEGQDAFVWLKESDSPNRKNFTMAHELGHLLLHIQPGTDGLHFRDKNFTSGDPKKEFEANLFARDVLMPKWWVREFRRVGLGVEGMANYFGVSKAAMEVRIGEMFSRGEL